MKQILAPLALVALLAGLLAMAIWWQPQEQRLFSPEPGLSGGDFTLEGSSGAVSLADFRGQVVAMYFGYTWCPDICPTGLAALSAAFNGLDAAALPQVKGLFISVDPARDDAARLAQYSAYFHPQISGVTGSPEQLLAVARQYGAAFRKEDTDNANYAVDHTADLYLVGRDGRLAITLPHGSRPEEILQSLQTLLAE